jgi:hypothetical protein
MLVVLVCAEAHSGGHNERSIRDVGKAMATTNSSDGVTADVWSLLHKGALTKGGCELPLPGGPEEEQGAKARGKELRK